MASLKTLAENPEKAREVSQLKVTISQISTDKVRYEMEDLFTDHLEQPQTHAQIERRLNSFMQEVNTATSFSDIGKKEQLLAKIGTDLQKGGTPSQLKVQYLKVCDAFSQRLLEKTFVAGSTKPLEMPQHGDAQVALAAQVRAHAAKLPANDPTQASMASFQSSQAPEMVLIGKRMDTGVTYPKVDSHSVKGNEVVLSRRALDNQPGQMRTELRFQLTPSARRNLDLSVFKDANFLVHLSKALGNQVNARNVSVKYEISQSSATDKGPITVKESEAEFAKMVAIELPGVGQILIGAEEMASPDFKTGTQPPESTKGRYVAHHTVIVRLYEGSRDEGHVDNAAQLEKMHRLLATAGLSHVISQATSDDINKAHLLQVIETYLPDLIVPIQNYSELPNLNAEQLQKFCLELLPKERREATERLINQEMMAGAQVEKTPLGNQVTKLRSVADNMRRAGAVGFFAGISGGPAVVTSMLKVGGLSSHERGYAGFTRPPTCQEDALSGGNDAIFVRMATEGGFRKLQADQRNLSAFDWISTFQMVVSLDAANLPHNRMHHNSFGIKSPVAEIVTTKEHVSGVEVLRSDDPVTFAEKQNSNFTLDNELMLRTGALDPKYIQKIVYQDPRKLLPAFLKKHGCPQELVEKLEARVQKGGTIETYLKASVIDFLRVKGLVSIKQDWSKKDYLGLNKIQDPNLAFGAGFNFGDNVDNYFEDPRENLIKELHKNGLINDNGRIMGKP
ncbi:MAG: hypothetical protein LLG04_18775 [Parachlamydia sp.]|nr:hypothetical protein [Parachlamydia sp.]